MNLNILDIKDRILTEKNWTLFLDRDGVINKRIVGDYIKKPEEFEFLPGVLDAMKLFAGMFKRIIIVTNQQGIGKNLMTEEDLKKVHHFMLNEIVAAGGRIDAIYHSPFLSAENSPFRKPQIGMALKAKEEFPGIDLGKSIMVGDSFSDMKFGKNAGMITVFTLPSEATEEIKTHADIVMDGLIGVAGWLKVEKEEE